MENKIKRKRIQLLIIIALFLSFGVYISYSIYSQSVEIKKKQNVINQLENELKKLDQENSLLKDPEYIKNEFRKKYNYVENDEKIINFPQNNK